MMTSNILKQMLLASLCLIAATNCSRLKDDEFSSDNQYLSETSVTLEFEAEVNTTTYKSITFTNRSETDYYEIFNITKTNDVCSAFSLFNITDADNNILFDPKESTTTSQDGGDYSLSLAVAPGDSLNINIEFSPIPCEIKEYQPTVVIYYEDNGETLTETVLLHAIVEDNSTTNTCADPYQISDLSELVGEEASRTLPEPEAGYYYSLVPYEIRGWMQPTEGFASLATEVSAYFGNPNVGSPYLAPYLPLEYVEDGLLHLLPFDECTGFAFITKSSDAFFVGAKQILISNDSMELYVETEDEENLGAVSVPKFLVTLSANINNSSSIIQADDGNFSITFQGALTTGYTETNNYLQNAIGQVVDTDGSDVLRIEENGDESRMYGSPLRHGEMILVGIGEFLPVDYHLSDEALSGLIETPAYIYIQMRAKIVKLTEEQIPIVIPEESETEE